MYFSAMTPFLPPLLQVIFTAPFLPLCPGYPMLQLQQLYAFPEAGSLGTPGFVLLSHQRLALFPPVFSTHSCRHF